MKSVIGLFLELAQRLTPAGYEHTLSRYIPEPKHTDAAGNVFVAIGKAPRVLFACHLDTFPLEKDPVHVDIRWTKGMLTTAGLSNLGADDKAGVALMLDMMNHKVHGLYGYFAKEEIGCLGSKYAADEGGLVCKYPSVQAVVAFDRRGTTSVVTHQRGVPTCSSAVARRLCRALNRFGFSYAPDAFGGRCDSGSFHGQPGIKACTNIGIGYYDEHTCVERLDVDHLTKLASAARRLDWNEALGL